MKRVLSVARLTLRLHLQKGNGGWLLVFIAAVAAFFFVVCQADGVLSHELQIRSRYGLTFSTSLLGICLLWLACYSMRGDIEAKRLHLLTSYPLHRLQIYLGKWLGLLTYGAMGTVTILVTIGLCCYILMATWADPQEVAALRTDSYRVYVQESPEAFDYEAEVARRLDILRDDGRLTETADLQLVSGHLREQLRNELNTLSPGGTRTRQFDLGRKPGYGDHLLIRYRFYTQDDATPVNLHWTFRSATSAQTWTTTTSHRAYATHDIEVPLSVVPPDGRFDVTIRGIDNPSLVMMEHTGLSALYLGSSLWRNCLKFVISMLLHYATIIAVGLTIGVAFTISVASFVAAVLYFLALSSSFFQSVLGELSRDQEAGAAELLGSVMIRLGGLFTTGLEPPAVIGTFSGAMAITMDNLGMAITRWFGSLLALPVKLFSEAGYTAFQANGLDLLLGFFLYLALAAALGIWLLTRKELDRVH